MICIDELHESTNNRIVHSRQTKATYECQKTSLSGYVALTEGNHANSLRDACVNE